MPGAAPVKRAVVGEHVVVHTINKSNIEPLRVCLECPRYSTEYAVPYTLCCCRFELVGICDTFLAGVKREKYDLCPCIAVRWTFHPEPRTSRTCVACHVVRY